MKCPYCRTDMNYGRVMDFWLTPALYRCEACSENGKFCVIFADCPGNEPPKVISKAGKELSLFQVWNCDNIWGYAKINSWGCYDDKNEEWDNEEWRSYELDKDYVDSIPMPNPFEITNKFNLVACQILPHARYILNGVQQEGSDEKNLACLPYEMKRHILRFLRDETDVLSSKQLYNIGLFAVDKNTLDKNKYHFLNETGCYRYKPY